MSTVSCRGCWPTATVNITAQRTRSICRLHALLCVLIEGGTAILDRRPSQKPPGQRACRRADHHRAGPTTAGQLVDEVRVLDVARQEVRQRHLAAIEASKTTVTEAYGIGPLMAAIIIGRVGDVRRFPTSGHFARHNGTAPIEASSGPKTRHRVNPRGPVEPCIHMAAVTQVRNATPGRAYYLRKQAEGKSRKEALRALLSGASATPSTDVSVADALRRSTTSSSHR